MEADDTFGFIDTEAGVISHVQLATLTNNALFLKDHMEDDTDVLMTPADEPILICSLPQAQPQFQTQAQAQAQPEPEPAMEATSPTIKNEKSPVNVKREGQGSSRRKSKRIQLRSSTDSDEGTQADPAAKATPPTAGRRMLPVTLREAKIEEIPQDPRGKVGTCAENPTLTAVRSPVKLEKEKDPNGKVGSCSGTLTAVVQIKKEKGTIPSGKATLCSENPPVMEQNPVEQPAMDIGQEKELEKAKTKELEKAKAKAKAKEPEMTKPKAKESRREKKKSRSDAVSGSSTSKAMPAAAVNLLEALKLLAKPLDEKYEEVDILDICAMKGIHFDPPRWHRPGGYDRKPNAVDKDKK